MVFNGFGVVSVSPEGGVNVDALPVNHFAGAHRDVVTVVAALNSKQIVGLRGKGGCTPTGFENGLGYGDRRQDAVFVATFDRPFSHAFDEGLLGGVVGEG